jgi:hypothetical protein
MAGTKKKAGGQKRQRDPQKHTNGQHTNGSSAEHPPLRRPPLSELVPVRFDPNVIDEVRARAYSDDRSVSAWIRRAVDRELRRTG